MEPKRIQSDEASFTPDNLQQQASLRESNSMNQIKSQFSNKIAILFIAFLGALLMPRLIYYVFIYQPFDPPEGDSGVLGMLYKQVEQNRKNSIQDFQQLTDLVNTNGQQKNKIEFIQNRRKQLLSELNEQLLKKDKKNENKIFQLKEQFDLLSKFIQASRRKDTQSKALQLQRVNWGQKNPMYKLRFQPQPLYTPSRQEVDKYDQKKDLILYTPAGRKAYLEILYTYLSKQTKSFHRWHLWVNTDNNTDIQYMEKLANENDWIDIITLEQFLFPPGHSNNIRRFWRKDCQKNKVYLRIDDDTVWMSPDFVDKMYEARIKNIQPIFIFANIINNAIIGYLHQRAGNFIYKDPIAYHCQGNGWKNKEIAKQIHQQFLESAQNNKTDMWKTSFNKWYALNNERISINTLIYFSNTINSMELQRADEEQLFSADISHYYERKNLVINDPICVHYAFFVQRKFLDEEHPQFLTRYQNLAGI